MPLRRGPDLTAQGGLVSVPAGAGVGSTARTVLASVEIASGDRAWLDSISVRIVDMAAYDQLNFALRLNGALLLPFDDISGEQFYDEYRLPIAREVGPGLLEIVAQNISGTTETGASLDPVAIRCVARLRGSLIQKAVA